MHSDFIELAARLARRGPLPSHFPEDWPKRPSGAEVARRLERAHDWLGGEAVEARRLGDRACKEIEALRAERDRLRGEVEKWKVCHRGAWEENESLAAENAGLRGSLESALREANEASNGADQCAVIALGIEAALASTSPLTSAVERALEAVGRYVKALSLVTRAEVPAEVGLAAENLHERRKELRAAHDHLQALLEGRGEDS